MADEYRFPDAELAAHAARLNQPGRLAALRRTALMDTLPEIAFDRAVGLATRIIGCPVGLLSLVDDHRQFFKAQSGLPVPYCDTRQTPLSHSFCQYVVSENRILQVRDAREHPLLAGNGAVADMGVIAYLGVPVHAPDGAVLGSFCAIDGTPRDWTACDRAALVDIAAGIESEIALRHAVAERDLLLAELNHRIKNHYTLTGALLRLSTPEAGNVAELSRIFGDRLQALARAHQLMVPVVRLEGLADGAAVTLRTLLETLTAPHEMTGTRRITLSGPDMILGPKGASSLALALHELLTNAIKHGGLSTPDGRLALDWQIDEDRLALDWTEAGAPAPVPAAASRPGFGTRLIQLTIAVQLGGEIDTDHRADGLRRRIVLPLAGLLH